MTVADLASERYVSLATFRSNGVPVATPVWAAPFDGGLVVGTFAEAGKIKRIRSSSSVTLAPCNFRGLVRGPAVEGRASILDTDDHLKAENALMEKYGWQWRLFGRRIDTYIVVR